MDFLCDMLLPDCNKRAFVHDPFGPDNVEKNPITCTTSVSDRTHIHLSESRPRPPLVPMVKLSVNTPCMRLCGTYL